MELDLKKFGMIKADFNKKKATRETFREMLSEKEELLNDLRFRLYTGQSALAIIQAVAQETQKSLEYHISSLVSTALASVWENAPKFKAEISIRRKQTECDLHFVEFEEESKPIDSAGGGPLDVTSFALRVSFWSLSLTRRRRTFILDEPFKFVSPDLQHKISDMLKMLSEKLNLQIIMISHAEEINYSADRTFLITKEGQLSRV